MEVPFVIYPFSYIDARLRFLLTSFSKKFLWMLVLCRKTNKCRNFRRLAFHGPRYRRVKVFDFLKVRCCYEQS